MIQGWGGIEKVKFNTGSIQSQVGWLRMDPDDRERLLRMKPKLHIDHAGEVQITLPGRNRRVSLARWLVFGERDRRVKSNPPLKYENGNKRDVRRENLVAVENPEQ